MRKSIERLESIHGFLKRAFAGNLHAKRILSLANGTLGVLTGASLAVSVIGHALAQARGLADRHAIKQVDRNAGVVVWDLFAPWVREVVGRREACRGRNRSSPSPRRSVREAMDRRIEHLVEQDLARRQGRRVIFARDLLNTLRRRELDEAVSKLSTDTGLAHRPSTEGELYRQRVTLASGRFAIIDDCLGFQLVPWRPALEQRLGQPVSVTLTPGGGIDWSFRRKRGLGL